MDPGPHRVDALCQSDVLNLGSTLCSDWATCQWVHDVAVWAPFAPSEDGYRFIGFGHHAKVLAALREASAEIMLCEGCADVASSRRSGPIIPGKR
jgi:hypothetical protein